MVTLPRLSARLRKRKSWQGLDLRRVQTSLLGTPSAVSVLEN